MRIDLLAKRFYVAPLAVAFALAGCGGGGGSTATPTPAPAPTPTPVPTPTPTPTPTSVERDINPATTNAAITVNLSPHFVINPDPAVAAKGKLFVMLPGTTAAPRNYQLIVRAGAQRGYHSIGLTYVNDTTIGDFCSGSASNDCNSLVRREVITGEDSSTLIAVSPANSVIGRLTSLLTYLNTTYPAENWGQFLTGGAPDWSKITIAGHSQGAGHAAYFAKLKSLDRTVMFSGPADFLTGNIIATWTSTLPNITPASRQYGFTHVNDGIVPYALATGHWNQLGLGVFGAVTSVDGASAPFGNTHQLSTNVIPPAGGNTHSAPVADFTTPLDASGQPVFKPVWNYLAFP